MSEGAKPYAFAPPTLCVHVPPALTDGAQPYLDFNGNAVTPTDQRLRRNFSAVIALRNLLP